MWCPGVVYLPEAQAHLSLLDVASTADSSLTFIVTPFNSSFTSASSCAGCHEYSESHLQVASIFAVKSLDNLCILTPIGLRRIANAASAESLAMHSSWQWTGQKTRLQEHSRLLQLLKLLSLSSKRYNQLLSSFSCTQCAGCMLAREALGCLQINASPIKPLKTAATTCGDECIYHPSLGCHGIYIIHLMPHL